MDGMNEDTIGTVAAASPEVAAPPQKKPPTAEEIKANRATERNAYYGVRPGTTNTAIPDAYVDDPIPMKIHYKVMNATMKQKFYDQFSENSKLIKEKIAEAQRWIADNFLTDWEGYITKPGPNGLSDTIPFARTPEKVTDECWDSVAIPLRGEILRIVLTDNAPTTAEETGVKY